MEKKEMEESFNYKYYDYKDVIKAFLKDDINQADYKEDGYIEVRLVGTLHEAVTFASFLQDLGVKTKIDLATGIYEGAYFSDKPMTFNIIGRGDEPYSITSDAIYNASIANYVAPVVISNFIKLFGFTGKDYFEFFDTKDKLLEYVRDPEKRVAINSKLALLSIENLRRSNEEMQNEISKNNQWIQYLDMQISAEDRLHRDINADLNARENSFIGPDGKEYYDESTLAAAQESFNRNTYTTQEELPKTR